jgi:hypothetical protein
MLYSIGRTAHISIYNQDWVPKVRVFGTGRIPPYPRHPILRHLDLIQQIEVTVEDFEQLHQRQRRDLVFPFL